MSSSQQDNNAWSKNKHSSGNTTRGGFSHGRGRGGRGGRGGGPSQRGGGVPRYNPSMTPNSTTQSTMNPQTSTPQQPFFSNSSRGAPLYSKPRGGSQKLFTPNMEDNNNSRHKPSVRENMHYPLRTSSAPPTTSDHAHSSTKLPDRTSTTIMEQKSRFTLNPHANSYVPNSFSSPSNNSNNSSSNSSNSNTSSTNNNSSSKSTDFKRPERKSVIIVNPLTKEAVDFRKESTGNVEAEAKPNTNTQEAEVKKEEVQQNQQQPNGKSEEENIPKEKKAEQEVEEEEQVNEEENEDEEFDDEEDGDEEDDEEYDDETDDSDYSESDDELVNGKHVYSREAMLRLQPKGNVAPPEVKGIEIFFDPELGQDQTSRFTTGYAKSLMRKPRTMSPTKFKKRDQFGSKRTNKSSSKMKKRSKKDAFEQLSRSENAWKVGQTKDEADRLYKEVTFILNILTPEKYDVLKDEFLKIKVDTEEILTGIIDIIFEKAVFEPTFAGLYAQLCKDMANYQQQSANTTSSANGEQQDNSPKLTMIQFKRTLLNKCQTEFEAETKSDSEDLTNLNEIELEERLTKIRRKKIGNIIFIGELFDKKMLSEKIIHEVIKKLLIDGNRANREGDLERLCKLLTTIGKTIDHDKSQRYMDLYFDMMSNLTKDKSLSSRIRFMLLDCIELRQNNWVPRIKTAKAKTIKEVHEDAEKEKKQKEMSLKSKTSGKGGYYKNDSRSSGTPTGKLQKRTPSSNDLFQTKERDKQQRKKTYQSKPTEIRLGPSSTTNAWGRTEKNEKTTKREELSTSNSYSLLDEEVQSPDDLSENEEKEELNKEHIENRTRGVFNTFVEEGEREESIEEYKKEKFSREAIVYSVRCLVYLSINAQNDLGEYFKLLKALHEVDVISTSAINQGLEIALRDIVTTEYYQDAPLSFKIFGTLLGRLVFEKISSFDSMFNSLSPLVQEEVLTGNQAKEIMKTVMETIAEEHEYADSDNPIDNSRKALFESSFNFLNVLDSTHKKQAKAYASAIVESKLDRIDTVARILLFVEENVAKDSADSELLALLHEQLGSDDIISTQSYSCKIFSAIYIASQHLEKFDQIVQQYQQTLKTILSNVDSQARAISEILKHSNNAKDVTLFTTSVKSLLDKGMITREALDQWKTNKKDKVMNKQEAIDALDKSVV